MKNAMQKIINLLLQLQMQSCSSYGINSFAGERGYQGSTGPPGIKREKGRPGEIRLLATAPTTTTPTATQGTIYPCVRLQNGRYAPL